LPGRITMASAAIRRASSIVSSLAADRAYPRNRRKRAPGRLVAREAASNVCFGSLADIKACPMNVRFTPERGHR
jgi:hypothetical protein